MENKLFDYLQKRFPIEIVYHILPYTYSPQPKELLEDIRSFSLLNKLLIGYYQMYESSDDDDTVIYDTDTDDSVYVETIEDGPLQPLEPMEIQYVEHPHQIYDMDSIDTDSTEEEDYKVWLLDDICFFTNDLVDIHDEFHLSFFELWKRHTMFRPCSRLDYGHCIYRFIEDYIEDTFEDKPVTTQIRILWGLMVPEERRQFVNKCMENGTIM